MGIVRVLHVIESLGAAGAEFSLLHLLKALAPLGVNSEVAVLGPPYTLATEFAALGIPVHRLGVRRFDLPGAVARLQALRLARGYDLIRSHLFGASVCAAVAVGLTGPPVVASHHALDFDTYRSTNVRRRLLKHGYGLLMRGLVRAHVGISSAVCAHVREHLGLRSVMIPNGFAVPALPLLGDVERRKLRLRHGVGDDALLIVCPARYSVEKGQEYLLEAVEQLRRGGLLVMALFFGAGPREQDYRLLAESLRIDDITRFAAPIPQPELMRTLAAADAVVLPSPQGEGFGRVLAEAMLLERAVVTTAVGGALDFIRDGDNGLLVVPRDGPALASALRRLALEQGLGARLGRAARQDLAATHGIDNVAAIWRRFYETVLRSGYRTAS